MMYSRHESCTVRRMIIPLSGEYSNSGTEQPIGMLFGPRVFHPRVVKKREVWLAQWQSASRWWVTLLKVGYTMLRVCLSVWLASFASGEFRRYASPSSKRETSIVLEVWRTRYGRMVGNLSINVDGLIVSRASQTKAPHTTKPICPNFPPEKTSNPDPGPYNYWQEDTKPDLQPPW